MDSTTWQDAEQERTFRAFIVAMYLLLDHLDRTLERDAGMPLAYFKVLACLSEAPECALRMSELATRLVASRSRLSHAIDRLEERGWVERIPSPTDKRGAFAVLTEAGLAVFKAAVPGVIRTVRVDLFDQLSPAQVKQLRGISEAINRHLMTLADLDTSD
jgi:DNA-binding MarR family transcriptional regulator